MDERSTERGVVNSTFARDVGALASINGDWSDGVTPVGLAIGNGFLWKRHYNNPNISSRWGFFGCDVFNNCALDALPIRDDVPWFKPQLPPYRFYNAVGGNGVLLLKDGARRNGCYDGCSGDTCRHPRSAVCYDQERRYLWLIAVDGRRSGASGMQCREMRDLVESLGCYDAMMLDGGGSTTLWADGSVRNRPSDGSQRSVANHLAIIYTPTPDPQCQLPSGAWCEGARLRTCTGGKLVNDGDCGAFGAACGEDGDWAFCVDSRCPGGDGTASACLDGTRIATCVDGQYSEDDCAASGRVCGADAAGGGCMEAACAAGPNSAFCVDGVTVGACVSGTFSASPCAPGDLCEGGACVTPPPPPPPPPAGVEVVGGEPAPAGVEVVGGEPAPAGVEQPAPAGVAVGGSPSPAGGVGEGGEGGQPFMGSAPPTRITPNDVADRESLSGGGESCAVGGRRGGGGVMWALLALMGLARRWRVA